MNVGRWLAPLVCTCFGLSCLIWGILASSYPASLRVGGAFVGILWLLQALAHVRSSRPESTAA